MSLATLYVFKDNTNIKCFRCLLPFLHVEDYLYSSKIAMATVLWNSHVSLPTGSIKEGGRRNPCLKKTIVYYKILLFVIF